MKFFQILYVVCIHVDLRCNVRSNICGTFKVGYLIKLDEPELYETKFILENMCEVGKTIRVNLLN